MRFGSRGKRFGRRFMFKAGTDRQPMRTRYLGHPIGYQPIRDQYFLIPSVPGLVVIYLLKRSSDVNTAHILALLNALPNKRVPPVFRPHHPVVNNIRGFICLETWWKTS
eukprot:sb/3477418/